MDTFIEIIEEVTYLNIIDDNNTVVLTDEVLEIVEVNGVGVGGSTGGSTQRPYYFSEESFSYSPSLLLNHAPTLEVPITIAVNGLILMNSEFTLINRTLQIQNTSAVSGDLIRVVYAYGGI